VHEWRRVAATAMVTWSLVMVGLSAWLWFGFFAWYASFGERYVGMFYRQCVLVIDGKNSVCINGKTRTT
jgi:hypothetical protein